MNSERSQIWDFSAPLLVERIVVYSHAVRPVIFTSLTDLYGKRIGVLRGWSYGDAFDDARRGERFWVEEVSTDEQNFLKLESGRVDAVLAIPESVAALLPQHQDILGSAVPLMETEAFLAFSKAEQRGPLLARFNRVLKAMKASGEFKRILNSELAR